MVSGPLPKRLHYSPSMIVPRTLPPTLAPALAALLITAGCSGSDATSSASPKASATPSATATATSSAFCLDLSTFQVGLLAYSADIARAIDGEPINLKEMRRRAALTLRIGEKMKSSAPPDIAEQFRTVLKALKTSSSNLKEDSTVLDAADPIYGKKNRAAFDAVDHYECKPGP